MSYGPPGSVPIPLKMSLYSFNMYSFVMGSLCTLPFSSMESLFHLILGITGSSVCLDCFSCVALLDSLFWAGHPFGLVSSLFWAGCPSGLVPLTVFDLQSCGVSGVCVAFVQTFFKVAVNILKACGSIIQGN